MMKNKSTFSMGRALILRIYGRRLQKAARVIKLHFNKLVHHIGGLLSLAFCSEREAAIEYDHEITTSYTKDSRLPSECKRKICSYILIF